MVNMVSPIVVLSRGGLRVAPSNKWNEILVVNCHEIKSAHLDFDLSLLCFEL